MIDATLNLFRLENNECTVAAYTKTFRTPTWFDGGLNVESSLHEIWVKLTYLGLHNYYYKRNCLIIQFMLIDSKLMLIKFLNFSV